MNVSLFTPLLKFYPHLLSKLMAKPKKLVVFLNIIVFRGRRACEKQQKREDHQEPMLKTAKHALLVEIHNIKHPENAMVTFRCEKKGEDLKTYDAKVRAS